MPNWARGWASGAEPPLAGPPLLSDSSHPVRPPGAPIRILLLFNQDYGDPAAGPARGEEARAGVAHTARAAEAALRELPGMEVEAVPVDSPQALVAILERVRPDVAFNLCESLRGDPRYEIPVPVILESHGIAYTGNSPFALRVALDKAGARTRLADRGVPVPAGCLVSTERDVDRLEGPLPAIVKPSREDGSIGIESASVVHDLAALKARARYVLESLKQPAVVEAFIEGREFNVSVLGDHEPACLPLAEIDFTGMPPGEPCIVSYKAKWQNESAEYRGTVPLFGLADETLARALRRAALDAFRALDLRDYARIDLRVDATGHPFVIDVNPNCDISPDAGFCKAAARAGISYSKLIHRLVEFAIERGKRNASQKAPNRRSLVPA